MESKKTTCVIIDDEPIAIKVIENYINRIEGLCIKGRFTNALDALAVIRNEDIDLVFLDIQMPGINGLEFVKSMQQTPSIIFTTAFRNFAADAFDVNAVDYLVKPIPFDRFLKSINKFFDINKHSSAADNQPPSPTKYIILKSDKKNYKVAHTDILYIESMDDYIKVHTNAQTLVCYLRLAGIEAELNNDCFIRIHRAYIINKHHINTFTQTHVEINGQPLPIGRNYRDKVVPLLK
ncbi:MAG TPA: LytTR family DNA-binding domain-containing protein [Tenuifilaceae bacterium]|nr:LytTR family DNA-binding domain-containing protein [Tenuifilaceae bacterium]HQB79379.1 LytTR family DNA-binding domain-containing protein [Tenuifilaceae bacterium]